MIPVESAKGFEMIPGLSEGIIGAKAGESPEVVVKFDENYMIEELRGTEATYTVKVHKVNKVSLPPIDDALAQRIGETDLETLKKKFTEAAEKQFVMNRVNSIEDQIIGHLNKEHQFELPQEQVYNETKFQVNRIVSDAFRNGMNPDELDTYEKQIIDNAATRAETNVRTRYILSQISEKEKIAVTEDELFRQIFAMSQRERVPIKRFIRELKEKNGIESIKANILIGKTIAFLREHASITEVEATKNEPTA